MKKLIFPKKFKESITKEIEENLESKLVKERENINSRLDQSFDSIISRTQSLIDSIPNFDGDLFRLEKQIKLLEEKTGPDISHDMAREFLSKIKIPLDGKDGKTGKKGSAGAPGKPYILTERDKLDITEPITREIFNKTVSEEKVLQIISDVIERLKNGKIRIKNTSGGANGSEIISKINTFLETTGWQLDVTVENPIRLIYIFGDDTTDGSVRLNFTEGDTFAHIEARASGVWNDTGFRTSSGSIEVGRDLKIEAAADFIKTVNPSGFGIHSTALIPHIPFSSTGTLFPHTPIVDVTADNIIFSTAISETSGTTISQTFPITSAQIISTITYEVGTLGATSDVQHTIYKGVDNTGDIISQMNLPSSDFVADTSTMIDFGSAFGFSETQENIFVEFTTDTSFTLKTDSGGNILITLNSQQLETRDLLYDDLIFDNNLGLVLTSDLNPVYSLQFP